MSSNRAPSQTQNQTDIALDEFAKQTQKLREVLAKYINGKPTEKNNKYYPYVVVKDDRNQTFLRAWWNIMTKVESFRKHMNEPKHPILIAAPAMAKYCYDISQEIDINVRYQEVAYLSLPKCPTMEDFNKMNLKSEAAYIRVKNKTENKLFCAVKHTKRFREIMVPDIDKIPFEETRSVGYLSNKKHNRLEKFQAQIGYYPQWANKDVYEVLKVTLEVMNWGLENATDDDFRFSAAKILPVINTFRKILPFDALLSFGRTVKPEAVPKNCTMNDYIDNQNKSDFSLNGHLKIAYQMIKDEIREYEYVNEIEPLKNKDDEIKVGNIGFSHFNQEKSNKREQTSEIESHSPSVKY